MVKCLARVHRCFHTPNYELQNYSFWVEGVRKMRKMLQDLCKNNYLISENRGRWTTYRLNPNFTKNVDSSFNASSSKSDISGDKPFSSEEKNVDTSHVDTSAVEGSHVDTSVETAIYKEKSSIQQRIMEACQEEYISVEEIAQKVNRAVKYLKNRVIPEMVKGGYLVKLYPQTNHPQQKYISKHTCLRIGLVQ